MKEKTADEMFEELGYENMGISYAGDLYFDNKTTDYLIYFYPDTQSFAKDNCSKLEIFDITMPELQAINKKCKELGWLDE